MLGKSHLGVEAGNTGNQIHRMLYYIFHTLFIATSFRVRRMLISISFVPDIDSVNHAHFLCIGKTAQKSPECCQNLFPSFMLRVNSRDNKIMLLTRNGLVLHKVAVNQLILLDKE